MSQVEVLLTVGKLDASLALLTTKDHHVIEFPTMLLPENARAGSIIKIQVSQNLEEEQRQRDRFKAIQEEILKKYGTKAPEPPILRAINLTQTSCVLAWDPLSLGSASLKSLVLYRKGVRSMVIPSPFKGTATKISGLSVDTPYEFQLKLSTTSGDFWSETVKVRTHKMTDMSGITVCLGQLDELQHITAAQIAQSLKNIGARPLQDHVAIDTTHFICNDSEEDDAELQKAKNNNIPIVRPEWIRACEMERKIIGVRGFYLDADPGILQNYSFPAVKSNNDDNYSQQATTNEPMEEEEPQEDHEQDTVREELHPAENTDGTASDNLESSSIKPVLSSRSVTTSNAESVKKEEPVIEKTMSNNEERIEEPLEEIPISEQQEESTMLQQEDVETNEKKDELEVDNELVHTNEKEEGEEETLEITASNPIEATNQNAPVSEGTEAIEEDAAQMDPKKDVEEEGEKVEVEAKEVDDDDDDDDEAEEEKLANVEAEVSEEDTPEPGLSSNKKKNNKKNKKKSKGKNRR